MSLQKKAMHGMAWKLIERSSMQIVQFGTSLVLARILSPAEFGLVGILMVFTMLAQVFIDAGFSSALIQKKEVSQEDLSSVFYMNVAIGGGATALLSLCSPYIAHFFNQPELASLMRVVSFTLLIGAFATTQSVQLIRNMDFKQLSKVSFLSAVVSGVAGISLALMGYGVWALVWQGIVGAVARSGLLIFLNRWVPSLNFSFRSVRQLFSYGSNILAAQLLDSGFRQIYTLVIGKVYTAADLGFYSRAKRLQVLTIQNFSESFNGVLFPVLSQVQDDTVRFERGFRKVLRISMFFNMPLMLGLMVTASPLLFFLYGEKWAPAIPYFQLLSLSLLPIPMHQLNNNALMALGHSGKLFRLSILKKSITVGVLVLTYRYGIIMMLWGGVFGAYLTSFIAAYFTARITGISVMRQIRDILSVLFLGVGMAACAWGAGRLVEPAFLKLIVQGFSGAVVYLGLCRLIRPRPYVDAVEQVSGMLPLKISTLISTIAGVKS